MYGYTLSQPFEVTAQLKPTGRTLDKGDPSFVMIGGFVFGELTPELILEAQADDDAVVPDRLAMDAALHWRSEGEEKPVVLLQGLEHRCNKGYPKRTLRIVETVGGAQVVGIEDFTRKVGGMLSLQGQRFVTLGLQMTEDEEDASSGLTDPDIVLDQYICAGAETVIMQREGISAP